MNTAIVSYGGKSVPMQVHGMIETEVGPRPDYISDYLLTKGKFFEEGFLSYLKDKFGTVKSYVDIGANIGNHAVFMREFMGAEDVTCFEPVPSTFEILDANCSDFASLHNVALSAAPGETGYKMALMSDTRYPSDWSVNMGGSQLVPGTGIKVKRLDEYGITAADVIKIDVEGMEDLVVAGAMETIERCKPWLYIEPGTTETFQRTLSFLSRIGYVATNAIKDEGNIMVEYCYRYLVDKERDLS